MRTIAKSSSPKRRLQSVRAGLSGVAIVVGLSLTGCAEDRAIEFDSEFETASSQEVPRFSAVDFAVPGRLDLVRGQSPSVALAGDPDEVAKVRVRSDGDRLVIDSEDDSWSVNWSASDPRLLVRVVYTELAELTVSGSGDAYADGWSIDEGQVSIAGSGDVELTAVDMDALSLRIGGSGDIEASGVASELSMSIAGSGDVDASGLQAQRAEAAIAGSGDIELSVSAHLKARIAGSGDIGYWGEPSVDESIVGSGSVRALGSVSPEDGDIEL